MHRTLGAPQPGAQRLDWYSRQLKRRPWRTKLATGAVGAVLADTVAQKLSRPASLQGTSQDLKRTGRLCTWSFFATSLNVLWYSALDGAIPGTAAVSVLLKAFIDQALYAPFGTVLFYLGMKTLEGAPAAGPALLRQKFAPTMRANYMVWPAAQVVNMALVPPPMRILYLSALSILWTTFLSFTAASGPPPAPEAPPASPAPGAA